jgi:hypothetical protein
VPRRPTAPDALADTLDEAHEFALTPAMEDELEHPHRTAQGSRPLPPHDKTPSGRIKPAGIPDREPYYDAAPEDADAPANVDLHGRMTLLEQQRNADARRHHALAERVEEVHGVASEGRVWVRRGVKVLGALGGLAGAALIYLLAFARASGDATATAREREAQRKEDHSLLLELRGLVGEVVGELRARRGSIGVVPILGPTPDPAATTEPP